MKRHFNSFAKYFPLLCIADLIIFKSVFSLSIKISKFDFCDGSRCHCKTRQQNDSASTINKILLLIVEHACVFVGCYCSISQYK